MKTFTLILWIIAHNGTWQADVADGGLSLADCAAAMVELDGLEEPAPGFKGYSCEAED